MSECRKAYPKQEIETSQICAGGDQSTKTDSCNGDSGGGLFVDYGDHIGQGQGNVHILIGLVSYGRHLCGESSGVYTRVDHFVPWIRVIIGAWR